MIRPLLVLCLMLLGPVGCDEGKSTRNEVGLRAESLAGLVLERLDSGMEERLDRYHGKVVILNVWASWCPPCRQEMPGLQRLADRLDPASHVVLGLSLDTSPVLVREYLREHDIRFANHIDRNGRQVKERLGISDVPLTVILGRSGEVLWSALGRREWGDPDVAAWVRGLK
ncbi:MAG: TlpA family protein disulfide reductase [Alphaproteobacteria bacterium]